MTERRLFAACVLPILCSLLFLAQGRAEWEPPPGPDLLGIYVFPTDSTMYANVDAPEFSYVTAYLCLTRCSAPDGISGWECSVEVPDNVIITWFPTGGLNIASPPEFAVGLTIPHFRIPIIRLCTLFIYVTSADPQYFRLHPVSQSPTIPGKMVYSHGGQIGLYEEMHWSSGDENLPVFGLNTGPLDHVDGDRHIQAESATWGQVKSLYR